MRKHQCPTVVDSIKDEYFTSPWLSGFWKPGYMRESILHRSNLQPTGKFPVCICYVYVSDKISVHVCACVPVLMFVYLYVCVGMCVYMDVRMHVRTYVCMCVSIANLVTAIVCWNSAILYTLEHPKLMSKQRQTRHPFFVKSQLSCIPYQHLNHRYTNTANRD